ncbi:hypothetical protein EDB84DRAFT_1568896 [Lactarius hengduanensis]|nr:hypothetical protein EDB84DRAFT_1568896 [Lactarius hengduanensis]
MRVSPPSSLVAAVLVPGRDQDGWRGRRAAELSCPVAVIVVDLTIEAVLVTGSARYDFILILIVLLFSLTDNLEGWDPTHRPQDSVNSGLPLLLQPTPSPSLLSEIFAVFRSVAMPRYSAEQPAFNVAPFTLVDDADDRCSAPHARQLLGGTAAGAPLAVAANAILDKWAAIGHLNGTTGAPGGAVVRAS